MAIRFPASRPARRPRRELSRRQVTKKPLLKREVDDKAVPPYWRKAVYANEGLSQGVVDRDAYVVCVRAGAAVSGTDEPRHSSLLPRTAFPTRALGCWTASRGWRCAWTCWPA
ncbi:hypothetical protein GCM10010289_73140 [Streptomyces violascens]|nr:hypothetical protein GCM10010289_73140 [Streptomyces violascens]